MFHRHTLIFSLVPKQACYVLIMHKIKTTMNEWNSGYTVGLFLKLPLNIWPFHRGVSQLCQTQGMSMVLHEFDIQKVE